MMNHRIYLIATAASLTVLIGCTQNKPQTIGSLMRQPQQTEQKAITPLSHQEVRSEYTELLDLFEEQHLKEQIERRVADVYMMEGVQDQNQGTASTSHYVEAIKAYRNILEQYPDSPDNAEVLYQLAKAYDLEGDQKEALAMLSELTRRHPHYVNVAEAHFRMGDIHFNNQNYKSAQASYHSVTQYESERLAINAHYMLGWSYYKQSQFNNSLKEFALVLDTLLESVVDLDELEAAQRPMAADTIHSISLALDKVGGAEAIGTTMPNVANKQYVWMIYDHLGEYYLEKELYESSAATFRRFISQFGNSDKAPTLHRKIINTYITGGFPTLALEEKEAYVKAYGLTSHYTSSREGMEAHVAASIKTYLDELARHYYNQGQDHYEASNEKANATTDEQVQEVQVAEREQHTQMPPEAITAFNKAADFYFQYAQTFPVDERIDEVYFLMSEALFLSERYADAIAGYERVAYHPTGDSAKEHAPNAGYAAIISYQNHIATLPEQGKEIKDWQAKAVASMLRYANTFHGDERAVSVLTNAAEFLFSLNQYQRALEVASDLIKNNESLDKTLKKTAYGIVAHSHFNLADYHNAKINYLHQRDLIDPNSPEYNQVSERLATAIYRKSEEIESRGDDQGAAAQLLKIKQLTPDSVLRVPAQYEAATLFISMKEWDNAIAELKELAASFPEHELGVEFPRRLAFAYEQNEDWHLAGVSYRRLAQQDPDEETRREALFIAGTMFETDKNYNEAITHFRRYANTYEEPTSTLMEARYNLAINYQRIGDERDLFWLNKIVEGHRQFPTTDRNRWLAAWANAQYGDHYANEFRLRTLYLPLAESLPSKNSMLKSASERYQMAADLGILEFATLSSYKIGDLYRQFAEDLRSAPRPATLTEEQQPLYTEIIEEQAAPFEQLAMELHQANVNRAWTGEFNEWIDQSFMTMRTMNPERFDKAEIIVSYGDEIR